MSNHPNSKGMNPTSSVDIAIALHQCIGETITVHLIPNGQAGIFMVFRGVLSLAHRQPRSGPGQGPTMFNRRYSLGNDIRCFISFSSGDVSHLSDNNTIVYLRA